MDSMFDVIFNRSLAAIPLVAITRDPTLRNRTSFISRPDPRTEPTHVHLCFTIKRQVRLQPEPPRPHVHSGLG